MANKSPTKKYGRLAILFSVLSILVIAGPMLYFIIAGFIVGEVVSKVILGLTGMAAIIILLIATLQKAKLNSPFWILTIGLSLCLTKIYPLLIFMGVGTILDELVFTPLAKHYTNLHTINKQIDKRG